MEIISSSHRSMSKNIITAGLVITASTATITFFYPTLLVSGFVSMGLPIATSLIFSNALPFITTISAFIFKSIHDSNKSTFFKRSTGTAVIAAIGLALGYLQHSSKSLSTQQSSIIEATYGSRFASKDVSSAFLTVNQPDTLKRANLGILLSALITAVYTITKTIQKFIQPRIVDSNPTPAATHATAQAIDSNPSAATAPTQTRNVKAPILTFSPAVRFVSSNASINSLLTTSQSAAVTPKHISSTPQTPSVVPEMTGISSLLLSSPRATPLLAPVSPVAPSATPVPTALLTQASHALPPVTTTPPASLTSVGPNTALLQTKKLSNHGLASRKSLNGSDMTLSELNVGGYTLRGPTAILPKPRIQEKNRLTRSNSHLDQPTELLQKRSRG